MKFLSWLLTAVFLISPVNVHAAQMPAFTAFTGKIIDITDYFGDPSRKFVMIEDENEALVNFVWSENTFVNNGIAIELGERITGYYDNSLPMIMIYPPQPEALAFSAANGEPPFVLFDRFNADMLSYSGLLSLNIGEDTKIILQDGKEFDLYHETIEEALTNRALMVFYAATTRSLPPQTTPEKIIVFFETAEHPFLSFTPLLWSDVQLIENDVSAGYVTLQYSPDGTVLLPLYRVAEAAGVELGWDGDIQRVLYGEDISFMVGEYGSTIIGDRTYVPLSFFRDAVGFNNAYLFEGQIEINNLERME